MATDRARWSTRPLDEVAQALRERNIGGKVALVGSDFLPIKYWPEFQTSTVNIDWVFEDDLVETVRRIKSPRELDCVREGGEMVTRSLDLLIGGLKSGKSEAEAAAEAIAEISRHGGRFHMVPCSHGEFIDYFAREPFSGFSTDVPAPGDLVRGWVYGPIWQGYWLDPGRTTVCGGKPSDAKRELVETCANIVEACAAAIRPSVVVRDVAKIGDRMTADYGGGKDSISEKWPLYGHANGLFWEHPIISNQLGDEADVYEAGMVVATESFLGKEGVGAAGFENNYILGEDGVELVTKTPTLWWD